MAFGAVVGSTAFFIVHGFRQNAEQPSTGCSILPACRISAKIFYLEVIDATFSTDGVIGAFAFTMAVPLILIGNGIGAFVVRELTLRNVDTNQKYPVPSRTGQCNSIFFLGVIMILDSFGIRIPFFVSPLITFGSLVSSCSNLAGYPERTGLRQLLCNAEPEEEPGTYEDHFPLFRAVLALMPVLPEEDPFHVPCLVHTPEPAFEDRDDNPHAALPSLSRRPEPVADRKVLGTGLLAFPALPAEAGIRNAPHQSPMAAEVLELRGPVMGGRDGGHYRERSSRG